MYTSNILLQGFIQGQLRRAVINSVRVLAVCAILSLSAPVISAADQATPEFPVSELGRVGTDPDIAVTVDINAPQASVFTFLTSHPDDYIPDAVAVQFDHTASLTPGTLDIGSERILTLESGESLVQRFLAFDSPSSYTYLTDTERSTASVPLRYAITRYELTGQSDGSTRLKVAVVYQPDSRILAFFVRRAFRSALTRDLQQAATVIEAGRQ